MFKIYMLLSVANKVFLRSKKITIFRSGGNFTISFAVPLFVDQVLFLFTFSVMKCNLLARSWEIFVEFETS